MDNDKAGLRGPQPRVLWGRIAFYALTLVVVFALGVWLGGRGEASQDELVTYREEVNELRRTNYELEQQVAALAAGQMVPPGQEVTEEADGEEGEDGEDPVEAATAEDGPPGDADPEETAEADPGTDELPPGARVYEVQAGDTLTSIAQEVYGDGSKYELIAAANAVEGQLVIGQELIIPEDR